MTKTAAPGGFIMVTTKDAPMSMGLSASAGKDKERFTTRYIDAARVTFVTDDNHGCSVHVDTGGEPVTFKVIESAGDIVNAVAQARVAAKA